MGVQFGTKLSDYAIIFILIFITLAVITDSRIQLLQKTEELTIWYDNAIDNAVQSAMEGIVELDDGEELEINKEEILNRLFFGLSINLGLTEGDSTREWLECFFPVLTVMMQDGIYSWEIDTTEDKKRFSQKIPYCLEREEYKIYYTFNDSIVFQDKETGIERKGLYQEIGKQYPIYELSVDNFDEIRRRTIILTITEAMNRQLEKHNRFAKDRGIQYYFSLPVIDMEEWYRTVDDVTLLCVFQGYPYSLPRLGTYHKVILSGARVHKEKNNWEIKAETEKGKDSLSGEEEFYFFERAEEEWEDFYFKEPETENIIEEAV